MNIIFRPYKNNDLSTLKGLIKNFYDEDPGYCGINDKKIENTVHEFIKNPHKGRIVVFELAGEIIGYAITINYWSNEYGGNIIVIDELYVVPAQRRKGCAARFLNFLRAQERKTSRGIQLEVGRKNKTALTVYKKNGFKLINNHIMFYDFNCRKHGTK
ncbi:MAG: GNAT family N-acetyltransferase [Spirochaetales bacterium]|nr:GNAT family N-acetyltransferase [Spirochaetales bacterium]